MESGLLQHLLSFENKFNRRFAAGIPLYKFCRLYEDRTRLSDEERQTARFVENETKTGYHVLSPFFVSLLRNHAIWFAPASHFNDPWDAGSAVSILRTNTAIEAPVLKQLFGDEEFAKIAGLADEERYRQIEDKLREVFRILRFTCFSKRHDSNPMWAHYADNHRGVCLRFLFMRPLPPGAGAAYQIDPGFTGYYPVRYSSDFTRVGDIANIGSAVELLHTKHPDWAYEQEVRFIKTGDPERPESGGPVSFHRRSLTHLMLGCRTPPPLWSAVEGLLDEFGYESTVLLRGEFDARTQSLLYREKKRKST